MSAFYAMNYGDRIELLTDGAVYTDDGTLIGVAEKVARLSSIPAAMTSRGDVGALAAFRLYLESAGARAGTFDGAMALFAATLEGLKHRRVPACEIVVAGISETAGPTIAYAATVAMHADFEPFALYAIEGPEFGGGPAITLQDLRAAGLAPSDFAGGLAGRGADLFELMRRRKGPNPAMPGLPEIHGIGGHVDLTTVRATGATTTRLRTWPDAIGAKIDPFAGGEPEMGNVPLRYNMVGVAVAA